MTSANNITLNPVLAIINIPSGRRRNRERW